MHLEEKGRHNLWGGLIDEFGLMMMLMGVLIDYPSRYVNGNPRGIRDEPRKNTFLSLLA